MFPDRRRLVYIGSKSQRGFLIPLAIFILVVMSFFAIALWRTTVQTTLSGAQELISVQAFYAAESGAQYAMNQLFDPGIPVTRENADNACTSMTSFVSGPNFSSIAGLNGCSVQVRCECNRCGAGNTVSYYTLISEGQCGANLLSATRSIRVSSFMETEE